MKNLSTRKWSLLGLVLFTASAVTAAVIPAKKDTKKHADGAGRLQNISNDGSVNQRTCISTVNTGNCHETTSGSGGNSATSNLLLTSNDNDANLDGNTTAD